MCFARIDTSSFAHWDAASNLLAHIDAGRYWNSLADLHRYAFGHTVRNLDSLGAGHLLGYADGHSLGHSYRNSLADRVRNTSDDFFLNHAADSDRNLASYLFHAASLDGDAFHNSLSNHTGFRVSFATVDESTFLPGGVADRFTSSSTATTSIVTSTTTTNHITISINILAGCVVIVGTTLAVNPCTQ